MRIYVMYVITFFITSQSLYAYDKYVEPVYGSDSNTGDSPESAYKTIYTAWYNIADGETIYLIPGIYDNSNQGADWNINIDQPKSVTFSRYGQDGSVELHLSPKAGMGGIELDYDLSSNEIAFQDIIIITTTSCQGIVNYDGSNDIFHLKFNNCIISDEGNSNRILYALFTESENQRKMEFINCNMSTTRNEAFLAKRGGSFHIHGGSLSVGGAGSRAIRLYDSWQEVFIDNCLIECSGPVFMAEIAFSCHCFRFSKCLVEINSADGYGSPFIYIKDHDLKHIDIYANSINYNLLSGIPKAIIIGLLSEYGADHAISAPVIRDNAIWSSRNEWGGGIYLGTNVRGARVFNNRIKGFQVGVYNNAEYSMIRGNIIDTTDPIILWGGSYNNVLNNNLLSKNGFDTGRCIVHGRLNVTGHSSQDNSFTPVSFTDNNLWDVSLVATDEKMVAFVTTDKITLSKKYWGVVNGKGLNSISVKQWIKFPEGLVETPPDNLYYVRILKFSEHNNILNNILDARKSTNVMTYDFNPRSREGYIDYNCYVLGSGSLSNINEDPQINLESMKDKWINWSRLCPYNDAHSIEAGPEFYDKENWDFRLKPTSPCLNAAKADMEDGFMNIGAWQAKNKGTLLPLNCFEPLEMDFNEDCMVNIIDFALFAGEWLRCNLFPKSECWK